MSQEKLIPDLNNLKNEYLDPLSYLKLIAVKPEEFEPKIISKILENAENIVPLNLFTEIYKLSTEYAVEWSKSLNFEINPLFISSILMEEISLNNGNISSVIEPIAKNKLFEKCQNSMRLLFCNFQNNEIHWVYGYIYGYIDDENLKNKFQKSYELFKTQDDEKYEKDRLDCIILSAFLNLKIADKKVYDTDLYNLDPKKLIPYVIEILNAIDLEKL